MATACGATDLPSLMGRRTGLLTANGFKPSQAGSPDHQKELRTISARQPDAPRQLGFLYLVTVMD